MIYFDNFPVHRSRLEERSLVLAQLTERQFQL